MTEQVLTPVTVTTEQLLERLVEIQLGQGDQLHNLLQQFTKKKTSFSIANVNIPFWALVGLMVKFAIAAIPAAILLFLLGTFLASAGATLLILIGAGV